MSEYNVLTGQWTDREADVAIRSEMDGVRIELADPECDLLREIADPAFTRNDVRLTYRLALRSHDRVDWGKVNRAIIERWSVTTLNQIKKWAWKNG